MGTVYTTESCCNTQPQLWARLALKLQLQWDYKYSTAVCPKTKSCRTMLLLPQVWLCELKETGILETQPIRAILQHTTALHDTEVSASHMIPFSFHGSAFL